ncbi:helix-turn-helix transcriptional regulator [Streptomyces sp. SID8499]|uniref:helix-turn-helix domain-containing protein n=1 Tax=Streptomyces sp. SID8499 TaxID=2706106 RepID=UPI0013CC8496|nr:helix-turn-helix transcriptional regulator [Streptomyces sp. SID8499]NED36784.1 helix-turn-helix domain-containing protein [Streptomyces sp. SID8499]NED71208.1 helix-turn-helix domain-containing protein [Streptomyces sp. SID9944]
MANIKQLDPFASPLDYYGAELRRLREGAGLRLADLGEIVFCTASLIGQIETALKVPTRDFSARVDAALNTDGMFSRLVGLVLRSQLPTWFQPFAEMESKATFISTYQAQLVYGLLQTPEYARAVLETGDANRVEELLAARLERQRILDAAQPPLTLIVLDEAALHRPLGGTKVMRAQLSHLLACGERPWVQIQILPNSAGAHASLAGSFTALRFDNDPDLVYTEDLISGHMTANPETVREGARRYASLQAAALSQEDSAKLIKRVMEERYGPRSAVSKHSVA